MGNKMGQPLQPPLQLGGKQQSFCSLPTDELLTLVGNELCQNLATIESMQRTRKFDDRAREIVCQLMRDLEQKLYIFNQDMAGKSYSQDRKQQDYKIQSLKQEVNRQSDKNNKLQMENIRLNKLLQETHRNKSDSEQTAKAETERPKQHNVEPLKKQSQQVKTTHGKQTGRDNPIESLRKQCQQMEKDNKELLDEREILKTHNYSLQTYSNQLKEEKDQLLLRLSKLAGDKHVDNNTAITDLSDPNRPTKLGEFYSEIYDNEWTDAFEALVSGDYDEITAIETLRLTLLNVIQFCEGKADLLLQKASDAVNLLFEEYRQSVMEIRTWKPYHFAMPKRQARNVAQFLRGEKSSLVDIKLQRRWEAKLNRTNGDAKTSSEKVLKEEHSKLNADTKLKQLRKDMASSMVPIVQKWYIGARWTNRCIEELNPYIMKCLYLGWMMVVQTPPLVLHEFPTEKEIKFDKTMYKEYTASGPLVSYVVWPALLLEENGPVICKGVAEGQKP
ncbi:uncharacterized protein LOC128552789 isoform X2 [Mercenaria mercenaria]|uniref:uncharacterized protein LOC128552789 isoform X2 n=1 Tax=Mercenaria mercenaria TaxID=6596 RepID=UPI00234EBCF6|nr:uncharacterized protein LOC128552789 isoform X2 [Mercenaria mercenaria]